MYCRRDCGKQFQSGKRINNMTLWNEYLTKKRIVSELFFIRKCSERTICRHLALVAESFRPAYPKSAVIIIDTSYFTHTSSTVFALCRLWMLNPERYSIASMSDQILSEKYLLKPSEDSRKIIRGHRRSQIRDSQRSSYHTASQKLVISLQQNLMFFTSKRAQNDIKKLSKAIFHILKG